MTSPLRRLLLLLLCIIIVLLLKLPLVSGVRLVNPECAAKARRLLSKVASLDVDLEALHAACGARPGLPRSCAPGCQDQLNKLSGLELDPECKEINDSNVPEEFRPLFLMLDFRDRVKDECTFDIECDAWEDALRTKRVYEQQAQALQEDCGFSAADLAGDGAGAADGDEGPSLAAEHWAKLCAPRCQEAEVLQVPHDFGQRPAVDCGRQELRDLKQWETDHAGFFPLVGAWRSEERCRCHQQADHQLDELASLSAACAAEPPIDAPGPGSARSLAEADGPAVCSSVCQEQLARLPAPDLSCTGFPEVRERMAPLVETLERRDRVERFCRCWGNVTRKRNVHCYFHRQERCLAWEREATAASSRGLAALHSTCGFSNDVDVSEIDYDDATMRTKLCSPECQAAHDLKNVSVPLRNEACENLPDGHVPPRWQVSVARFEGYSSAWKACPAALAAEAREKLNLGVSRGAIITISAVVLGGSILLAILCAMSRSKGHGATGSARSGAAAGGSEVSGRAADRPVGAEASSVSEPRSFDGGDVMTHTTTRFVGGMISEMNVGGRPTGAGAGGAVVSHTTSRFVGGAISEINSQ